MNYYVAITSFSNCHFIANLLSAIPHRHLPPPRLFLQKSKGFYHFIHEYFIMGLLRIQILSKKKKTTIALLLLKVNDNSLILLIPSPQISLIVSKICPLFTIALFKSGDKMHTLQMNMSLQILKIYMYFFPFWFFMQFVEESR